MPGRSVYGGRGVKPRGRPTTVKVERSRPRAGGGSREARFYAVSAMRRAATTYLASRGSVKRDLAFITLPGIAEENPEQSLTARCGVFPGAADLIVWTGARVLVIGLAPAKGKTRLAQDLLSATLRRLGHEYRLVRAETPAHAVEQIARLIDGVRA